MSELERVYLAPGQVYGKCGRAYFEPIVLQIAYRDASQTFMA